MIKDVPHPLGHNAAIPAEAVGDQIDAAIGAFKARLDALVKDAGDRAVTDNDSIGRAADVRSMIRALNEAVDARGREIAEPHGRAVAVVRTRVERFLAPLVTADAALEQRISACRAAQRERARKQAQEQADREATLRVDAGVASPQIDMAPPTAMPLPAVRGDYGSRVGDRTVTTYVYSDVRALPLDVLNAPDVAAVIQKVLRVYAKLHREIPGVEVTTGLKTSHRRPN